MFLSALPYKERARLEKQCVSHDVKDFKSIILLFFLQMFLEKI